MNNRLTKNELSSFKKLLQKKYRLEQKKFLIEGKHLIEEAIKNKNINLVITSDRDFIISDPKIEIKYCSYQDICSLSTTKTPQEYIGVCDFFSSEKVKNNSVIVLNKINDPGNLGTIIRTAHSFGIENIVVEGVDIYNPKVLRSTQGSIFNINIYNTNNLAQELIELKNNNFVLVGSLLEGAKDFNKVQIKENKIALILGNEANGIESKIIEMLDYKVYIPIKFESLNVAVAAGILISKYWGK